MSVYAVKTMSGEFCEFNKSKWIRVAGKVVRVSSRFEMDLLTSDMPTNPEQFRRDVEEFYCFLRRENTSRARWQFRTTEIARQAYEMLFAIGEKYM